MVVYRQEGVVREWVIRVKIESASPKAEEQRASEGKGGPARNEPARAGRVEHDGM